METLEEKIKKLVTKEIQRSVAVLECLVAENVNTIFGYPGGAIMPIYDALYDYSNFEPYFGSS